MYAVQDVIVDENANTKGMMKVQSNVESMDDATERTITIAVTYAKCRGVIIRWRELGVGVGLVYKRSTVLFITVVINA